jgi:lipopolysaccharide export system permease protein
MRLLQRYILLELFRTFAFLLIVVTVLLVFVGVFNEANTSKLGPVQILQILPFVVPSLLPFTIPATLLLAVCVVFGRVAADHEITAAKSAGISVMSLLWPAFLLGAAMSICSILLTDQVIPWAIGNIQKTIALALEDIFINRLRATHEVTDKERGFSITVMAVRDKTLIRPCFKYVRNGRDDVTVQAQTATLEFDLTGQQVILHLLRAHIDIPGRQKYFVEKESWPFPLPYSIPPAKARHLGIREIRRDLKKIRSEQQDRRHRQDAETALALAVNNVERLWMKDYENFKYHDAVDTKQAAKLATEVHSRFAMATSCLVFVLLGSPFAIIQARRQFLTSFIMCFFPILVCYYPLMMLMMNQSKAGVFNPAWAMWVPNVVMVVFAGFALRRVRIH